MMPSTKRSNAEYAATFTALLSVAGILLVVPALAVYFLLSKLTHYKFEILFEYLAIFEILVLIAALLGVLLPANWRIPDDAIKT